jgi:hypothetical protein
MGARGPKPIPEEDRRTYRIGVWLNEAELRQLERGIALPGMAELVMHGGANARKGLKAASEVMRAKALGQRIRLKVPEVNLELQAELGRLGNNVNQIARAINSGLLDVTDRAMLRGILDELRGLRDALHGASHASRLADSKRLADDVPSDEPSIAFG